MDSGRAGSVEPRGAWAAGLYAVWPGNVYYSATLMTEPVFDALLVGVVAVLAAAIDRADRRLLGCALAGLVFGTAALVKAEPLALTPVFLGMLWCGARNRSEFFRAGAVFMTCAALVLTPWVVRNYRAFDRLVVTTATGGANAWLGNHPGASGGQDIVFMRNFMERHARPTSAETLFAASASGWREVADFVSEQPGEALAVWGRKLALTYGSDGHGARLVRGVGVGRVGFVSEAARSRLAGVADAYWFTILILAAGGLLTLPGWPVVARIAGLGIPLVWLVVHLVFLGGPRFHAPETPWFALLAASGIGAIRQPWRRRRESTVEVPSDSLQ